MTKNNTLMISNDDVMMFGNWSHDVNPLHVDPEIAGQTYFKKTIAHGILTIIEALIGANEKVGVYPSSLEAEFRRPVFPNRNYFIESDSHDDVLNVILSDDQGICLRLKVTFDGSNDPMDTTTEWPGTVSAETNQGCRQKAADIESDRFKQELTLSGSYVPNALPEQYLSTSTNALTPTIIRILGLCSYLVGMEVPGLRSLFTRISLTFIQPMDETEKFVYRLQVRKYNETFRTLQTTLEVASENGQMVAIGELRSYVRFSPGKIEFERIANLTEPLRPGFEGKVALICGGSRGLGAEMVAALALSGCQVVATHRTDNKSFVSFKEDLADRGLNVHFMTGDAGDAAWCQHALNEITDRYGRLDILVLNACASPEPMEIISSAASGFSDYVGRNLDLVQQPLTTFLPLLEKTNGSVTAISSSFVEEMPKGFAHYVALKQAVEATIHSIAKDFDSLSFVIPRPPRLQTSWNDTPSGVMGAIPVQQAALSIMKAMATAGQAGAVNTISEFPPLKEVAKERVEARPDLNVVVSASFTVEPILSGLKFWFEELGHNVGVDIAPYGQVLQELINPTSMLSGNRKGFGCVLIRIGDWLRELSDEKLASADYVREYLEKTCREFVRAMRTHRAHAGVDTILIVCPSAAFTTEALNAICSEVESELIEGLKAFPGLTTIDAKDFHSHYCVQPDNIHDPLREQIGHIPFQRPYFHVLATIIIRHIQKRLVPLRKVVILDCDNTLWDGVVGEVGADGVVFNDAQVELHQLLTRLSETGIIICLCSKNEDFDVWSVFDNRPDFGLSRERIVAAMINWKPKSENIRQLASKLSLGLDSFVFIDDNPVECAEVQAACPEVLTLQWPRDVERSKQLLRHTWELDVKQGTKEDAKRTQMYREEFKRQELLDDNISFGDFIKSLELKVDLRPLNDEDLPRASQLTMRTNQFNFTTIRRKESELKPLMDDAEYECGTIRVHDRFGDYGLVGLFIAKTQEDSLLLDTFLLSCRILGRGVEHHLMAELGRKALARNIDTVKMYVDPTPRNTPAREFLASITPDEFGRQEDSGRFTCELPSEVLADLAFEPEEKAEEDADNEDKAPSSPDPDSGDDNQRMRSREDQIERAAYALSSADALTQAIDGSGTPAATSETAAQASPPDDIQAYVYDVFSAELNLSVDRIKEVDELAPLGCDSFKIVEITVLLIERFPWLPITLLFEHRSVSDIADHIASLAKTGRTDAMPERMTRLDRRQRLDGPMDIAVVGMDVRCSGADSPDQLWSMLRQGESGVRPVTGSREYFLYPLKDSRPHWAGLMDRVDGFDAEFFGIAPREAELMDPQIRLFLEVAWGALEDAGLTNGLADIDVGVYAGKMYDDYVFTANHLATTQQSPYRSWEGFSMANRLSHFLNLKGPSFTVNTACSSSGTALHLACQAIINGDCHLAIAGGSNLILDPERFGQLGRLGILSPSGRCRPFGEEADGTVLGEGVGVVVLKALDDAMQDGDRIYGVIKGSALSTGTGTVGFTVPNPNAQAMAIRKSLAAADVDPRTITYVETHGTGTQLGDPIEVRGLTLAHSDQQLWDNALDGHQQCRIGSIKPNIGHLESGACIMGLIKILLQFKYGQLVPTITSETPNPQIPFNLGPFKIQTRLEPWNQPTMVIDGDSVSIPRRAGLSSFGVGGANAHLILEEPPAAVLEEKSHLGADDGSENLPMGIVTLSARHEETLVAQADRLATHLEDWPEINAQDVCFTTNQAKTHFHQRLALIAYDRSQLIESARAYAGGEVPAGCFSGAVSRSQPAPKIGFLFTGQGSQYIGMGKTLYDNYPIFKSALDRCAEVLDGLLERPILEIIFSETGSATADLMDQTGFTQPALFAVEYAVSELWQSWGIEPDLVMGHSVGEIVALTVAGVLSLDDGLKLIAARGKLMQALPSGGKMAAIRADEERVMSELANVDAPVSVAALNGPQHTVISGDGKAVDEMVARFEADGIKATMLKVSHAFHSPLIEPMLEEYTSVYRSIRPSMPKIPVISCVDGRPFELSADIDKYWTNQVRLPVRFTDAMAELDRQGTTVYLEVGPHPVLLGMGSLCLPYEDRIWLPSLRRDASGPATLAESLAKLYAHGCEVDWENVTPSSRAKKVALPTYPFRHRNYWIDRSQLGALTDRDRSVSPAVSGEPYIIEWQPEPISAAMDDATLEGGEWVVFADDGDTGRALVQNLDEHHASHVLVRKGKNYSRNDDGSFRLNPSSYSDYRQFFNDLAEEGRGIRGVVYLWALDLPETQALNRDAFDELRDVALTGAINICRALSDSHAVDARLWLVTKNTVLTGGENGKDPLSVCQFPIWGFGRVLSLEHPEMMGGLVDLPSSGMDVHACARALCAELMTPDKEDQVAVRQNGRFVPRLKKQRLDVPEEFSVNPQGRYLITGGTGALGLRLIRWLVDHGARHLTVTGRGDRTPKALAAITASLENEAIDVEYVSVDVASATDMERLKDHLDRASQPLKGIAHLAGVDIRKSIMEIEKSDLHDVMRSKVDGSWRLHLLSLDQNLDFFVTFSSIASILGSDGRSHYAAANAFLDGLAHYRLQAGLPATAINWGPWKDGGMASSDDLAAYRQMGNHGLDPEGALDNLKALLMGNSAQTMIADIDWATFRGIYSAKRQRPLIADLESETAQEMAEAESRKTLPAWVQQLNEQPMDRRESYLTLLIQKSIARMLGFDDPEDISNDLDFTEMGMDSLRAVELILQIQKNLGIDGTLVLYDYPNISVLAKSLIDRLDFSEPAEGEDAPQEKEKILGYSAGIEADVLDFYRTAWPNRPSETIEPRWRWMFLESAKRIGVPPKMWVYREASSVVGFTGAIAVTAQLGPKEVNTAWCVDTMVLESCRKVGLGPNIMIQVKKDLPFSLSLGQTKEMRMIMEKLGWQEVAPFQTYVYPINPQQILQGKLNPILAFPVGSGMQIRQYAKRLQSKSVIRPLELKSISRFEGRHDALWLDVKKHYPCAVVRDASYLNWKYVEQPGQEFIRLELLENNNVVAVAVLMLREPGPKSAYLYRRSFIVDLIVRPDDEGLVMSVLDRIRGKCVELEVDSLIFELVNPKLEALIEKFGFLKREPTRFFWLCPEAQDEANLSLTMNPDNWLITKGDSDVDRPEVK